MATVRVQSDELNHSPFYLYLHGFASGPGSAKAQYLRDRFTEHQLDLVIPDLNQDDFTHLTLTRQLDQAQALLPGDRPVTIIGSSFGGLTAAWLGQMHEQVQQVILLAPAFQFLDNWLPRLGEQLQRWQTDQVLPIYHYAEQRLVPLNYTFIEDLRRYNDTELQRPVPTIILHGCHDEVVPLSVSQNYAAQRPWVQLIELDSDHSLGSATAEIWQTIQSVIFSRQNQGL